MSLRRKNQAGTRKRVASAVEVAAVGFTFGLGPSESEATESAPWQNEHRVVHVAAVAINFASVGLQTVHNRNHPTCLFINTSYNGLQFVFHFASWPATKLAKHIAT